MQNKPLKKTCIIIGTGMLTVAAGLSSYSLVGMLNNPAFLEVTPGWVEHQETVAKPIVEALQNASIDPNTFCDGLLIGAIVLATVSSIVAYVCYERSEEKNDRLVDAIFSGIFAFMAAFGIGEIVAYYTLAGLADYTSTIEYIAVAAGVVAALGIITMVAGSLADKGQERA